MTQKFEVKGGREGDGKEEWGPRGRDAIADHPTSTRQIHCHDITHLGFVCL